MNLKRLSFTLIEMLIVIVIIGILAAALVPRLQSIQGRARDTKRKADLSQIVTALEIYKTDYNRYPSAHNGSANSVGRGCTWDCWGFSIDAATWITGMSTLLTSLPHDPIDKQGNIGTGIWDGAWITGNYFYSYGPTYTPNAFSLMTQLENKQDPDRCGVNAYKFPAYGTYYERCGLYIPEVYEASPYRFGSN